MVKENMDNEKDGLEEIVRGLSKARVLTREEQERLNEERYRELVTPELLARFTEKEALNLVRYFGQTPSSSTQDFTGGGLYGWSHISQKAKAFLASEIRGRRVIELGDAGNKTNARFFLRDLGAKSFETADPKYIPRCDGLSYLVRQPEESAIVTSFGVFDEGVLHAGPKEPDELFRYRQLLADEIYRVTPIGGITLHGLDWYFEFERAGFKEDASVPSDLNTWNAQYGGFKVLRKI